MSCQSLVTGAAKNCYLAVLNLIRFFLASPRACRTARRPGMSTSEKNNDENMKRMGNEVSSTCLGGVLSVVVLAQRVVTAVFGGAAGSVLTPEEI